MSALIIGSMSPDFQYYILLELQGRFSHSLLGQFLFCLPVSLLVYFFWNHFSVFWRLSPNKMDSKKESWWGGVPPMRVIFSILAGAFSHISWDAFTHFDGAFVGLFPILQNALINVHGHDIFIYNVLQHLSSVVGLSLVFIYTLQWMQQLKARLRYMFNKLILKAWVLQSILFVLFTIEYALRESDLYIGNIIVKFISAGAISIILVHGFIVFHRQYIKRFSFQRQQLILRQT